MRGSIKTSLLVLGALAVGIVAGRSIVRPRMQTWEELRQETGLDRTVKELHAERMPLAQVIDRLEAQTHATIAVNWGALKSLGVDERTPVNLHLREVPLAVAMKFVLREITPKNVVIACEPHDGVIEISSGDALASQVVIRMYDIRDLINAVVGSKKQLHTAKTASTFPTGGQSGGVLFGNQPQGVSTTEQEVIDEITKLIEDTVKPESWRDAGGVSGSIRELGGHFVIEQTPSAHAEIVSLLEQLRHEMIR